MFPDDAKLRLIRNGVFLFILGLLTGFAVPILKNPRMGVSAHLGGTLDGMFLILLGLIWTELRMPARMARITFWLMLYAAYAGWAAQLLAAFFGTSRATPIAGAGYAGAEWQEILVYLVAVSFSVAVLLGCGLLLYGLRRKTGTQP